jgi:hypothetical protein
MPSSEGGYNSWNSWRLCIFGHFFPKYFARRPDSRHELSSCNQTTTTLRLETANHQVAARKTILVIETTAAYSIPKSTRPDWGAPVADAKAFQLQVPPPARHTTHRVNPHPKASSTLDMICRAEKSPPKIHQLSPEI